MKLIAEIEDKDLSINGIESPTEWKLRKAARAIVVNEDKILLMYASKNKYHKLPGGGIENNEDIMEALEREIMEETGCKADVKEEVGMTIEYRSEQKLIQISYCYLAKFVENTGKVELTEKEQDQGLTFDWVNSKDLIEKFNSDTPLDYSGKFISYRDNKFIDKYLT